VNFHFNGESFKFAKISLGYFDEENAFRCKLIWIITSQIFKNLMHTCVFINSILLCYYDFSVRIDPTEEKIKTN